MPLSLSPLDMMLTHMQTKWAANEFDAALTIARAAAPYVHPRAQPTPPQATTPHSDADILGWSFATPAPSDDDPYDA